MERFRKILLLLSAVAMALALTAGPVFATEGGSGTSGEEGATKVTLPDSAHDRVGLVLIGFAVVAGGLALNNARKNLRGDRRPASGEWRWR